MLDALLACPRCDNALTPTTDGHSCNGCRVAYPGMDDFVLESLRVVGEGGAGAQAFRELLHAAALDLASAEFSAELGEGERSTLQVARSLLYRQDPALATERGAERLDACAFRVPVGGRMVSMCELNATGLREELLAEREPGPDPPLPMQRPVRESPVGASS